MSDIFSRIKEGLQELFPEAAAMEMTKDTQLGQIPDWDSMASVNFQSFIEQNFQVTVPQDLLGEEITIGEVISFIENPEKMA